MDTPGYEPIAGCAPVQGEKARAHDRLWLVVDADGAWMPPSAHPALAGIQVEFRYGYLVLRAPGMLRTDVPLDVIEDDESVMGTTRIGDASIGVVDEGDLLAAWLSNFLGQPCRLVKRHPPQTPVHWPDR